MPTSSTPAKTKTQFSAAITATEHLKYCGGLSAIPPSEGRHKIVARDTQHLLGSANIDEDCQTTFPQDNRWDFVVGYHKSTGAVAFFIEEHSATSGEVSCMGRKLNWLKQYLNRPANATLNQLPKQFHWLAHDGIKIPTHLPQYRHLQRLRGQGLCGPVTRTTTS
jgi:hypothetical protein